MQTEIVIAIIVAMLGSNGLWELVKYRMQKKYDSKNYVTKQQMEVTVEQIKTDIEDIKHANKVGMQDRLHYLMMSAIKRGTVTTYEYKIISNLYEAYVKDLKGNSFIEDLHKDYEKANITIIEG